MIDKRGIELSMNFIVILIISIVIFGFGVNFISRLSSQAKDLQELTVGELDDRIGNLICEGSTRVCVGIDRKTINRKKFDVFGLKIINVLDRREFNIDITRPSPPSPSGYDRNNVAIQRDDLIWNPKTRTVLIEKNEEKNLGIGIQVPADAVPGTYIFNVEIKQADGNFYSATQKLYVDVSQ